MYGWKYAPMASYYSLLSIHYSLPQRTLKSRLAIDLEITFSWI
jgi:hypothetical protein